MSEESKPKRGRGRPKNPNPNPCPSRRRCIYIQDDIWKFLNQYGSASNMISRLAMADFIRNPTKYEILLTVKPF